VKGVSISMSLTRKAGARLRRLPSNVAGQTVVTYAIAACLFAAALVLGTSIWRGGLPADPPVAERGR
jgi:hypothetical protein